MEFIFFVLGLMFGGFTVAVVYLRRREKPIGVIMINDSDPYDEPYLFLKFYPGADPNYIMQKTKVVCDVSHE